MRFFSGNGSYVLHSLLAATPKKNWIFTAGCPADKMIELANNRQEIPFFKMEKKQIDNKGFVWFFNKTSAHIFREKNLAYMKY